MTYDASEPPGAACPRLRFEYFSTPEDVPLPFPHTCRRDSPSCGLAGVMVARLSLGPASVSELAAPLDMSLPAVLQHLQVLEASGLVRSRKDGRVRTCRIEPAALQTAEDWIARRRIGWERRLDRLAKQLGEGDD